MRSDAVVLSVALACSNNIPRVGKYNRVTVIILALRPKSSLPG